MGRMIGLKKTGKLFAAVAVGGICLSPLSSQQLPSRVGSVQQAAGGSVRELTPDKEVTLATDGSFRAAVLTRSGLLVPGARITIASQPKGDGEPLQTMTGASGVTVISGLKAGLYRVRVQAPQGAYEGNLRITVSTATRVSYLPAPLVAFTLGQPANASEDTEDEPVDEDPGDDRSDRRRRLLIWGLGGAATAIALPLALQGEEGRGARRASP